MTYRFELHGATASEWASENPVLLEREPGVETDTGKLKIGDGATPWNSLAYVVDWSRITNKPTTFPPTIGSTGTTAMRGNAIVINPVSTDGLPDGTLIART